MRFSFLGCRTKLLQPYYFATKVEQILGKGQKVVVWILPYNQWNFFEKII